MTSRSARPLIEPWKISVMAAAGTLLPLLVVAFAFALTPLPVPPGAGDVLRLLVRMAVLFVGVNAVMVALAVALNRWSMRQRQPAARGVAIATR